MTTRQKKPPPEPRAPVRRAVAVRAEDAPEPEPKKFDIRDNSQLRWLAGLHYATNLEGTSIVEMAKIEPFTMVTEGTLGTWARRDRWIEKRREYRDQIATKIRSRLGDEHVRHHIRMLKDMQAVYETVVQTLNSDDAPKPKSFESLLNSYTKLVLAIGEIRRDVVGFIAPRPNFGASGEEGEGSGTPQMVPEISEDEARIAAEAILRQRLQITDGEAEEEAEAGEDPQTLQEEEGLV